jgi:hypothetical protein
MGTGMSFGKRGAGGDGVRRPPPPPPRAEDREAPAGAPRMALANPGGFDLRFAALALGVVAVAAGGALAAPSVFSMFGGSPARPIETIIAGLDRDQVKAALAVEALPDREGAAFMAALEQHFPESHDKLLGQMADTAMHGGNRDSISRDVNEWLVDFAPQNISALGRTGARGFDFAMGQVGDVMRLLKQEAGGCTANSLQRMLEDPRELQKASEYGSPVYDFNMRFSKELVELAAAGRSAPVVSATLTPQDETALQSVMLSLLSDKDVMNLVQLGMSQANGQRADFNAVNNIDVCDLGHTLIEKLDRLPDDTKGRLLALGASELRKFMANGGRGRTSMMPGQSAL